ncbi:hypothetical protein ABFS83_12G159600 [Erythranthe nasuta]
MAFDIRQVMAAFLTFSMFIMLGNMIKTDHIDPLFDSMEVSENVRYDLFKVSKQSTVKLQELDYGPWRVKTDTLKPCWKNPSSKGKEKSNNGYIFFSLTHGPEFHASQVANAVAVAKHLGATLVIPDIRGTKLGDKRQFGDIYDVDRFVTVLKGIVKVDKNAPAELSSNAKLYTMRIPNGVSEDFIASKIEPVFKREKNLKIVTYLNGSSGMNKLAKVDRSSNAHQCLAMYESLKLKKDLQELVDSMAGTLRSISRKTRGRFVAVDLRDDILEGKSCQEKNDAEEKTCFNAEELSKFFIKIGFHSDTTFYVTQTGWSSNLNPLRKVFPNTLTKDAIIPADQKAKLMDLKSREYEKFIDYYMCVEGDVFIPAFRGRFYGSVVGERIAYGNTQIFLPSKNTSSESAVDYISPYVSKKSHVAYSCYC